MELAAEAAPAGVILTTDADAAPANSWVEANLQAIAVGADIVGGRIVGDPVEEARLGSGFLHRARLHARYGELRDELAALIDPLDHDPWPRHHDHTGGSLAVRSSVYRAVGGMDAVPFREDLAFVSKVRAAGYRLSHPLDVIVTVSARTQGRAKGGMADCLRTWIREEAEGTPVLFESPAAVERRLRRRKAIRDLADVQPAIALRMLQDLGIEPGIANTVGRSVAALIERHASDDPDAPADCARARGNLHALREDRISAGDLRCCLRSIRGSAFGRCPKRLHEMAPPVTVTAGFPRRPSANWRGMASWPIRPCSLGQCGRC